MDPFQTRFHDFRKFSIQKPHIRTSNFQACVLGFMIGSWFLDGFAPSHNPDMWSDGVFREVARLSQKGTRLATFTAASAVRRGLVNVGFDMVKMPGFGRKREMLTGIFL